MAKKNNPKSRVPSGCQNPKSVVWLTDIHLNFVNDDEFNTFIQQVIDARPDAVLIRGDIAESHNLLPFLDRIEQALSIPIHFVLGNHDFYRGSIQAVREQVVQHCSQSQWLNYLTAGGVFPLSEEVGLIGHDGWGDGRAGNYDRSEVFLNDYVHIKELAAFGLNKQSRGHRLATLGDEAADHLAQLLPAALGQYRHVVLLTHVPPVREACWHNGRMSDDQWAPHFVCQAVGEAILAILREHPRHRLTVLCGHSHGRGECRPLGNVHILTGGAEYGCPEIQEVFQF